MQQLSRLCLLALLTACGPASSTGDKPADKSADKPADKPAASAKEEVKDRSQTPLTTTKDTIAGVSFAIDLPAGLKREENAKEMWINWTAADGNPFMEPSITVKVVEPFMIPKDLDAFVRSANSKTQDKPPLVVARQEELPDGAGMLVVTERSDGQFFKVEVLHRAGDKPLRCTILQRTGTGKPDDQPIPSFAATRAWAEKICTSVKIG